jgi:NADP-dependent aldehyde dehydrogenase
MATGEPFAPTIDTAAPDWLPAPRPDLRSIRVGIGVVLVFAASNFPFAFSVAGGDTASAWAAGCPVVVKAHPGHPLLSTAVADVVRSALADAGAPAGMFGIVHGIDAGVAALRSPMVAAGAFTGSVPGGLALHRIASTRSVPIPFFAEMGSVNPVVVTERAAAERAEEIATGLHGSFLLGSGQFCTKPGLVLVPEDSDLPKLVADLVADQPAPLMLSHGLRDRHREGFAAFLDGDGVRLLASGREAEDERGAAEIARVAVTSVGALLADIDRVTEEHFGPSTVFVTYQPDDDLGQIIAALPGSLTGTVWRGAGEDVGHLVAALAGRVGRVLVDDWPTGVAITWAQFHGGPFPATTDARHTAVGVGAISRFLRTVAYQNVPQDALPAWLRDRNPDRALRRIDGVLSWSEVPR